ncbi:MAG: hypothetical protein ACREL7_05995 [Longimicrobiales bacterium]
MFKIVLNLLAVLLVAAAFTAVDPPATLGADCAQDCHSDGDFHHDTNLNGDWSIETFHSMVTGYDCPVWAEWDDHKQCDGDAFIYDENAAQLVFQECDNPSAVTAVAATDEPPAAVLSD